MRVAYVMTVRPGREEGYKESHRAVWPELIAAASQAGIRNHSVFLHGRTLFLYLEADNIDEAMQNLKSTDVKTRWDEYMQEFLEPDVTAMEEVFYME